jgi:hypothetical protein
MIFNKYKNCKEFSNERIDLEELIATIKDNPLKSEIIELRSVEYKSAQYDKMKLTLPVITPHGTFKNSTKNSIENLSGYMYFDIDGFDTLGKVDETIKKLNNEFPLTLICKSVGGRGLAFFLKVNGITEANFDTTHAFIRNEFKNEGYKMDDAAGGLIRKWIITYDPDIIYHKDNEYKIDKTAYEEFVTANKTTPKKIKKIETDSELDDDDDELELIPFGTLCKLIKTESVYMGNIDGDFTIEEMEYYRISYQQRIKDGQKHNTYTRIIHALYYLNNSITISQVFSYIFYINSTAEAKMSKSKLKSLVTYICNKIKETGEILIKTRIKKIHFNEDSKLTKREKQSIAARINGAFKSNKTKELIQQTIAKLEANNIKVTKKRIAQELKIDVKTVQRNWKKDLTDISTLEFTSNKKPKKIKNNLDEFDYDEEYIPDDDEKVIHDSDFFE